jgi:hypothetical protein
MKPRKVPNKKEKSYKYIIYKEKLEHSEEIVPRVILHLIRRNRRTFDSKIKEIQSSDKCLFFKENLPVAMTPNEDVKDMVKRMLPKPQYKFNMSKIKVPAAHVPTIIKEVQEYFTKIHN